MGISIEHLFTRQCPRSASLTQVSAFKRTGEGLTQADYLTVLGFVQKHEPIGAMVLNVEVTGDHKDRAKLVAVMRDYLRDKGLTFELALALAETAVHEVCDARACKRCHGTGHQHSSAVEPCRRCEGLGQTILSERRLVMLVNRRLIKSTMSRHAFRVRWYQVYADVLDQLGLSRHKAVRVANLMLN